VTWTACGPRNSFVNGPDMSVVSKNVIAEMITQIGGVRSGYFRISVARTP